VLTKCQKNNWRDFLCDKEVLCGICHCSNALFNTWVYDSTFIKEFTNGEVRICKNAYDAESFSEAKTLLQIRLNRLKEFL